ncbi:formin related protein [Cyclospora cayetanensis]|uniref:Formin related protein n=1 Tax=Cyclospora cayetanensis TaxID=88456 RepID=A0A1D3D018_9EIME|nr:formin related protein [Cyclospora cayetanensis]
MPALGPLGPSALVDGAALSRLFSRTQSSAATKAASKRATKRPEVQQVKLISSKRAQNVAIVLARLSLSTKEAARRLQCLDSSGFSLELLDRLEQVCPLPEELEAFQAYLQQQEQQQTSEDPKADSATTPPLRDVEAEMLPLVRLTGVSLRTRVVRFDLLAPKTLKELNDALDLVDQAAEQASLLAAVLQWGNYVNHGVRLAATPEGTQSSEEGGAAGDSARGLPGAAASVEALPTRGFALTSLLKLMEFRSTVDSRLSSLHYILVNLGLPEEMPLVEEAARLSDEALDVAAALLHRETQFLLQQIQQAKPSNEFWGPSEIEKLRRLHGEAALGFQGVRQRYAASKERVTELARFYGEEPQRPSAAAAAAAGEGWGGLMRASPFSTLAAILVTFKQTLRDIQQHPKRYAVLLATNSSTSDPKQGNAEEERRGKKEAPSAGESASPGEPPFAAALPKKDQGATFKAPAIAATTGSQLHAHFTRKCSDPIAATCATPRGLRGLGAALMQPEHHHHQPCTPLQQPHGHETSVAVRLPVSGPPSASEGIAASVAASGPANPKDAQAKRPHGLTAAAAAALLAKSNSKLDAKSYRASLHALLDEPSFPALDLAASINKALFVRELSGEEGRGSELPAAAAANEAAGASVESHSTPREPAKAAERTQQMLRAVQAPLPAVATSPRLPGNLGNDSEHQKRAVASVGNVQFFPPRVVPKQLQRLPSTPPHVWRPILRPRLPPPAVVPGKYPRGSQNKAVPPTIGEGRGKQQPNAQESGIGHPGATCSTVYFSILGYKCHRYAALQEIVPPPPELHGYMRALTMASGEYPASIFPLRKHISSCIPQMELRLKRLSAIFWHQRNQGVCRLQASAASTIDAQLLGDVDARTMQSHIVAMQDPAGYCSSTENVQTHFCVILREYAAACLALEQLEGQQCHIQSLKDRKQAKRQQDRAAAKESALKRPGKRRSKKSGKKGSRTQEPVILEETSLVELPSPEEQEARWKELTEERERHIRVARENEGSGANGADSGLSERLQQILDASAYLQSGSLLLTGMAKEILGSKISSAGALPEGASMDFDPGFIEGILRSVLVEGTAYAQPLAPFCVSFIENALMSINSRKKGPEEAGADAFLLLTSLDALVCTTAKLKATVSAAHPSARASDISALVKQDALSGRLDTIPDDIASQIVDLVLSIIDHPEHITGRKDLRECLRLVVRQVRSLDLPLTIMCYRFKKKQAGIRIGEGLTTSGITSSQYTPSAPGPRHRSACIVQGQPILGSACMHGIQETIFISVHPVRNTEGQTGQASGIAQGSPSTQQGSTGTHYDLETPGTSQTGAGTLPHASVDVTPKSVFALRFGKGGMEYVDSGKVNLAQVTVPGLSGTTVPLTSLPVFQDKDQQPKYGVHFHDIQTDYILGNRGTKNDICITDAMVLPTGGDSYTPGEGPPQSLAALAASAVERWSLRKMHEATHGTVTLFRDNNTIEQHVQRLLTKHHANIADATTPAPSFNTLTSSGCKSYSDEARRLFYEYYASAQLFWSEMGRGKKASSHLMCEEHKASERSTGEERLLLPGHAEQNEKYRVAHLSVLNSWMDKGKKVKELSAGITSEIETYALGLERYVNILLEHSETQGLFSLAAHSWVQMRGIYNAAEGYLPGKGDTISKRNKQLAAIFAKLWYEMDLGIRQPAHSVLKPFPAMLASVTLQVAFFLHSVVEGFKNSIWRRMGAAVKSFFAGIFRKNKKMKAPSSWGQIQSRAHARQRTDAEGFQGALSAINQLAKMFHKRFLEPAITASEPHPLLPAYISFIHALVAQWMVPFGEKLNMKDPTISKAKKLFYHNVFVHPKGLTHVAAGIITNSCKDLKKIDMGRVKATVEASGKRQNAGNTILKHRNVSLRRSELEHHLNILLSTYVDPLDLIRTAQDLATRCSAQSSALASDEPPPQEETKEKRKLPQVTFKKPPKGNPDDERVVQMLTSKFVLDSWCLKYRDYVMRELASVPKTTDSNKLVLFLDGVLDKTSEIVLVPGSVKTSWVINLKCPFMRDFVDPQLRQSARHEMLQYALCKSPYQIVMITDLCFILYRRRTIRMSLVPW